MCGIRSINLAQRLSKHYNLSANVAVEERRPVEICLQYLGRKVQLGLAARYVHIHSAPLAMVHAEAEEEEALCDWEF